MITIIFGIVSSKSMHHRMSVMASQVGMTEVIFVNHGVKVNGQYYCDVLLSQQMLSAIKLVAERCLFTN